MPFGIRHQATFSTSSSTFQAANPAPQPRSSPNPIITRVLIVWEFPVKTMDAWAGPCGGCIVRSATGCRDSEVSLGWVFQPYCILIIHLSDSPWALQAHLCQETTFLWLLFSPSRLSHHRLQISPPRLNSPPVYLHLSYGPSPFLPYILTVFIYGSSLY